MYGRFHAPHNPYYLVAEQRSSCMSLNKPDEQRQPFRLKKIQGSTMLRVVELRVYRVKSDVSNKISKCLVMKELYF